MRINEVNGDWGSFKKLIRGGVEKEIHDTFKTIKIRGDGALFNVKEKLNARIKEEVRNK